MNVTSLLLGRGLRVRSAAVAAFVLVAALATAAVRATILASTAAAAPILNVLTSDHPLPAGNLFLTLGSLSKITSTGGNGSTEEVVTPGGKILWSRQAPAGDSFTDFQVQTYEGQQVLTFAVSGTAPGLLGSLSSRAGGTDYILNNRYQQIGTVVPGPGYLFDGHEFLITPQGEAWITARQLSTANLTSIGGPADQEVINGVVQEIDIKTGKVRFTWNSADHVPYADSYEPLPASASQPWDWFHVNAVSFGPNGTLLISSRHTWSVYDVDASTGNVNWVLGGRGSTLTQRAAPGQTLNSSGDVFAWQHDPQYIGDNRYWVFDDENGSNIPPTGLPYSRAVEVQVDPTANTATVIASRDQPEGMTALATGGVQPLGNGDLVVGWGTLPYVSIYNGAGDLIYNAKFTGGLFSYRAYLLNWPPPPPGG